jgi:hypothetical protein
MRIPNEIKERRLLSRRIGDFGGWEAAAPWFAVVAVASVVAD